MVHFSVPIPISATSAVKPVCALLSVAAVCHSNNHSGVSVRNYIAAYTTYAAAIRAVSHSHLLETRSLSSQFNEPIAQFGGAKVQDCLAGRATFL